LERSFVNQNIFYNKIDSNNVDISFQHQFFPKIHSLNIEEQKAIIEQVEEQEAPKIKETPEKRFFEEMIAQEEDM